MITSQLSSGSFLSSATASPKIILFNGSVLFLFNELLLINLLSVILVRFV